MKMKTTFRTIALAITFATLSCQANAQEILTGFFGRTENAGTRDYIAPAHFLPFFDDFSHSNLFPDSTKWTDRNVLVNDGFPLCPPNRNAATFDVLDANGCVYDYAISNAFVAEYLTSAQIRLDSIMEPEPRALTPADSVYLSFYYQPQGNGNAPETQDSLVLQFGTTTQHQEFLFLDYQNYSIADIFAEMQVDTLFPGDTVWASAGCLPGMFTLITDTLTPSTQGMISIPCDSVFTTVADTTWYHVWSIPGQTLESFMADNDNQYFKQVMIPITDPKYFQENFYFRFYNYASIVSSSLPSNRSNEDNWNIDFVYINANRNAEDTTYPMLSFSGKRPSFFNRYQSMPYRQYRINPNSAIREKLELDIANLDGIDHEVSYHYSVQQLGGSQHYSRMLDPVTIHPYREDGFLQCPGPEEGESPACPYVGELFALSFDYDSVSYFIKHYVYDSTCVPPLIDSMVYRQGMYNYYAYDDGIPELGYGVEPSNGRFAVKFELADYDTIQGVQLLFNHTLNDANNKYFDIAIWKDENGVPGEEIYRFANQRPQWQEHLYRFSYYEFDQPVTLVGAFYIGIIQQSNGLINIGLDTSIDNQQYNYYNVNGSWQNSSAHGSLMIRPVVGSSYYIGIDETTNEANNLHLYPNPASSTLHLEGNFEGGHTSIYDLTGRKVYQGDYQNEIPISNLNDGLYFLHIVTAEGKVINQKFIIKK